jgi:hypothetical protein
VGVVATGTFQFLERIMDAFLMQLRLNIRMTLKTFAENSLSACS